jgi:hypothetical protein
LRRPLCLPQPGRGIDLELTVRRLSQALFLAELPRERRRRWGPTLHVIEDRSARLIPYRLDQYLVREALRRLLPAHALDRSVIRDGMSAPRPPEGGAGSIVLALGDLGCLSGTRAELCERWLRFGRDLRAAGRVPVALIPGPLERCPARLARHLAVDPLGAPAPARSGGYPRTARRAPAAAGVPGGAHRTRPAARRAPVAAAGSGRRRHRSRCVAAPGPDQPFRRRRHPEPGAGQVSCAPSSRPSLRPNFRPASPGCCAPGGGICRRKSGSRSC